MKILIEQLSKIKRLIIKQYIDKYPDKPFGFSGAHCIDIDRGEYDEDEITNALYSLIKDEYFRKKSDSIYIMPLDVHRYVKSHINSAIEYSKKKKKKKKIEELYQNNQFYFWIIAIIIGILIAIVSIII